MNGKIFHKVETKELKESLLTKCSNRRDNWSECVQARLLGTLDIIAVNARYHNVCLANFKTGRNIPGFATTDHNESKKFKGGRQIDEEANSAFLTVAKYLEQHFDEQITVNELIEMMSEKLQTSNSQPYSFPHMKSKLSDYFNDNILFTNLKGK